MEFRLYTFVNFYLSSIQQGIQTAHVLGDMAAEYRDNEYVGSGHKALKLNQEVKDFWDWNTNHKTIITLNGGANGDIENTYKTLRNLNRKLLRSAAISCFYEDEYSLGGVMTACGIIVSSDIYESLPFNKLVCTNCNGFNPDIAGAYYCVDADGVITNVHMPDSAEAELAALIKSCPLAR